MQNSWEEPVPISSIQYGGRCPEKGEGISKLGARRRYDNCSPRLSNKQTPSKRCRCRERGTRCVNTNNRSRTQIPRRQIHTKESTLAYRQYLCPIGGWSMSGDPWLEIHRQARAAAVEKIMTSCMAAVRGRPTYVYSTYTYVFAFANTGGSHAWWWCKATKLPVHVVQLAWLCRKESALSREEKRWKTGTRSLSHKEYRSVLF